MPNWSEVMEAQAEARDALTACDNYGGAIEDGQINGDVTLAVLLAARAVGKQIVASEMALRHTLGNRG